MAMSFNIDIQKLTLKSEYINSDPIEVRETLAGFGGVLYTATKAYFDPKTTLEEDYPYFFELGLDYLFDVVSK
jgi:hypothetical protein